MDNATQEQASPLADKFAIFKSHLPSMQMIAKDGTPLPFVNGKLITKVKAHIDELRAEIANGHSGIFIDPNESEVSDSDAAPMQGLRDKIRAEIEAEFRAAQGGSMAALPNAGYYEQPKLNVASSVSLQPVEPSGLRPAPAVPIPSQPNPVVNLGQGVNIKEQPTGTDETPPVDQSGELVDPNAGNEQGIKNAATQVAEQGPGSVDKDTLAKLSALKK